MGSPSLKWETNIPHMPIGCVPYGCVAEINGMLYVGYGDRMFQFKKGAWEGEEHHLPGIKYIRSVFECEGKGYVMDINDRGRCLSIYEWKIETRELKLLTKIPDEYKLLGRSAIGHNGNIYLVGGIGYPIGSDRVDCFDINKGEWEPIKKMKNEREECSLAVIDDKIFVGGGRRAGNSVECFSMEKQQWIDIKPTTKELCQLSSWNGKLVATGGEYSKCVEMYDELSGKWLPFPSMNKGRWLHGACTTKDNQLIVVGGHGAWNSVECLKM
ncbi:kelch-like protein 5 [Oscarella lobularis]|uniref:kelch-like protein 5 n=1 Tax=Oscarella lobularis TaxID=121494 RepID=UPI0033133C8C